jgi:hypothetical protein
MSHEKDPLRIRYEYEENPESRMQYAHGVWGGINPQGEVEMNFYTESDKLPPYSERLLAPDGSFGHEITPGDDDTKVITRRIHSKLILNYYTARAVLEWLQDKVDTLEEESGEAVFFDDKNGMHQ